MSSVCTKREFFKEASPSIVDSSLILPRVEKNVVAAASILLRRQALKFLINLSIDFAINNVRVMYTVDTHFSTPTKIPNYLPSAISSITS